MKKVATRFAPSPTGPLHIGGVRTALFNWLYSKNKSGKFYLRIEDTDKERSKEEHKIQIINSLKWMGIEHYGEEYIQSKMISEHVTIAKKLLENGNAYKCSSCVTRSTDSRTCWFLRKILCGFGRRILTFYAKKIEFAAIKPNLQERGPGASRLLALWPQTQIF